MRNDQKNVIVEMTFEFALNSIQYGEQLEENRKYILANQFLRSATSIGANVREAQNAESKKDFIHKMKIAAKELDETKYWLELMSKTPSYPSNQHLIQQIAPIERILNKIISTSKKSALT